MDMPTLRLNPRHDPISLAERFAGKGRLRVEQLVDDATAHWLADHLRSRTDWRQILNSGDKVFELDRQTQAGMTSEQRAAMDDAVHAGARHGFQYRYETIRVPHDAKARAGSDDPLARFAEFMSSEEMLGFLRHITGATAIDFADAQATAYAPGDFLTAHDDGVASERRHAAYVFGLSADWRAEWGGLLLFHDREAIEGFVPAMNTLSLFAVPQLHSVSQVTRATPMRRYSITGWLRSFG